MPDPGEGGICLPGTGGNGRAAPFRSKTAGDTGRQRKRTPCTGHECHPHSPDAGHHFIRRSEVSVVDELPANRLPIKNCVVGTSYRPKAYEFIAKEVASGRQAYVICPMVEEGESEDLENVVDYTEKLRAALPPSVQVAYLHGKMRPADKNRIMEEFANKEIDVLVSTTVIEVASMFPMPR